jgi:hypothetical protein
MKARSFQTHFKNVTMIIYSSDRHFSLFDYHISHSQLLLRSSKTEKHSSNIDIIIFGVNYIQMFTFTRGIVLETMELSDVSRLNSKLISHHFSKETDQIYQLQSSGESFYIVGAHCRVYENDLDLSETSLGVLDFKGREKEIARSKP